MLPYRGRLQEHSSGAGRDVSFRTTWYLVVYGAARSVCMGSYGLTLWWLKYCFVAVDLKRNALMRHIFNCTAGNTIAYLLTCSCANGRRSRTTFNHIMNTLYFGDN